MQQTLGEFGDPATDIADADDADGFALRLSPDQCIAIDVGVAPQRAIGLDDPLRQPSIMLSACSADRIGIAAGPVDNEHARGRAGVNIDRIEPRTVAG